MFTMFASGLHVISRICPKLMTKVRLKASDMTQDLWLSLSPTLYFHMSSDTLLPVDDI